jgi:hypothetical protein
MVLHDDRSRGTRVSVEVRGKLTRFTIELRNLPRAERRGAERSVAGFADALARNLRRTE